MRHDLKKLGPLGLARLKLEARDAMRCRDCGKVSIIGGLGLVCPDGHGRIFVPDGWELDELRELFPDLAMSIQPFAARLKAITGALGSEVK
jgi:hypothetical protein